MANYENIRPYAEFAHTAALRGGVEKYLNQIANTNYQLGVMDARSMMIQQLLVAGGMLGALCVGGLLRTRYKQKAQVARRNELQQKRDEAFEAIVQREREAELYKSLWENHCGAEETEKPEETLDE